MPLFDEQDLDGASLPELAALLGSENPRARADALCALGDRLRTHELSKLEESLVQKLVALLDDTQDEVQLEAAITLAEMQDSRATPILVAALRNKKWRLDAIRALGALGDRSVVDALTRLMTGWLMPWADRMQSAAALCRLQDQNGARYLEEKLKSRREAERAAAIHFLAESKHPQARDLLLKILSDTTHAMRVGAARALGLLGDPSVRPALIAARHNASNDLLEDIEEALQKLPA